ncbi:MAG: M23 family metallopeptidase [Alistipes sp.]
MKPIKPLIAAWWKEFLRKRRISVLDAVDRSEEWHIHLSPANIFAAFVSFVLMLFILILSLVAYTPVLEFLPGYRTEANRSRDMLIHNVIRLDSMERVMNVMMTYNNNIALIMEGKTPVVRSLSGIDSVRSDKALVVPSREDSLLRAQLEGGGAYGLGHTNTSRRAVRESIEMVTPIEGIITDRFDIKQGRYGVRLAASAATRVSAIDNGTVVMSLWTPETGYIIQLQHAGNLLSVYKNMSKSLVSTGQTVKSGEQLGYSAEATTEKGGIKPFEFELWSNGKPVDPVDYMIF